nr:hypothetical protein [Pseudactinotalea terrae]
MRAAKVADAARQQVNGPEDLVKALRRWGQKQHDSYGIGYLALHGSPGAVYTGRKKISMVDLGGELQGVDLTAKCLHLGSCAVLDGGNDFAKQIRQSLGVRLLSGFTQDVDWFESMAFELLFFAKLVDYVRPIDAAKYMEREHSELVSRLGFIYEAGRASSRKP